MTVFPTSRLREIWGTQYFTFAGEPLGRKWDGRADVDEAELIRRARQGDQAAFAELYRLHHGYVQGIGRNILRDDNVDDLCQDTFLLAFTRLDSFAGNARFRTWITRIAINQCMMLLRKRRRFVAIDEEEDLLDQCIFSARDAVLEGAPARMDLDKMMGVLKPSTRRLLVMAYLEGLSEMEIAEAAGLSVQAVRNKLYRAKHKMRDAYEFPESKKHRQI